MGDKLIIAWICHFTNKEIQNIIKPWKKLNEIAPWIPQLTKLMENENNIELHIISPHEYINGIKEFTLRGIYYHFYNAHMPIWGRHWPYFFRLDHWTNFFFNNKKVRKLVNKIQPDLIHLHGAENAYYSSSILQFRKLYPILVTIQGFVLNATSINGKLKNRIKYEKQIIESIVDFGYRTQTMGKQIKEINPEAKLHWHHYPITIPQIRKTEKKYDIVFFARISKDKGAEDLLKACSLIKAEIPNLSVCIIGKSTKSYDKYLREKAKELNIENNIYWAGFLPHQQDVHNLVSASKVSVLPTSNEIISGTIIESMFLKIPVVAYDVGSIHEINQKNIIIQLVNKGDIVELAEKSKVLLKDEKLRTNISRIGFERALEMFNNEKIVKDLYNAYNTIIVRFIYD